MTAPPHPSRVGLVAVAWGRWPVAVGDELPGVAGFVASSFSPLVAEAAERCLRAGHGEPPAEPGRGERTAVVLISEAGDVASAVKVARAVDTGARVGPLMFFQSVPNAVAGYVAARWGLGGPVVCLGTPDDGLAAAALLIEDGDADEALVVFAEQAAEIDDAGPADGRREAGDAGTDRAVAVLVRSAATAGRHDTAHHPDTERNHP